MNLIRPGRSFRRMQPFVGTTVFHWYGSNEGSVRGPWPPIGGRATWTGEPAVWAAQIRQIMMANIDAVYLHCMNQYESIRINYFKACNQLRHEGYEIPKISPFLDPFYIWRTNWVNVSTEAGKDEFVSHYIRFFEQYLSENSDPLAYTDLLHVDGKIVLSSWYVYTVLGGLEKFTREDVERRLFAALGDRIPTLANGIYMMTAALIDPDLTFSDERMILFSGFTYAMHSVHNGIDVWHVQPGYWDQNIRRPGFLLPRDGGRHYRAAWDAVVSNAADVKRVYVESWNEYDEGSGIYPADPSPPFVVPAMNQNTDVFSSTNDPLEYVKTTAQGAARINRRADDDAVVLGVSAPGQAKMGSKVEVRVVVRNEGNAVWSRAGGYALRAGGQLEPVEDPIADGLLEEGIFRGRPCTFYFELSVPDRKGTWVLEVTMEKSGKPIGLGASVAIEVSGETWPGTDAKVALRGVSRGPEVTGFSRAFGVVGAPASAPFRHPDGLLYQNLRGVYRALKRVGPLRHVLERVRQSVVSRLRD